MLIIYIYYKKNSNNKTVETKQIILYYLYIWTLKWQRTGVIMTVACISNNAPSSITSYSNLRIRPSSFRKGAKWTIWFEFHRSNQKHDNSLSDTNMANAWCTILQISVTLTVVMVTEHKSIRLCEQVQSINIEYSSKSFSVIQVFLSSFR